MAFVGRYGTDNSIFGSNILGEGQIVAAGQGGEVVTGTSACERCHDEVATDAVRCPTCGFEPASQVGTTVVGAVALAVFVAAAVVLASSLAGGRPVAGLAVSPTLTAPVAASSGAMLVGYALQHRRTPTDSTLF